MVTAEIKKMTLETPIEIHQRLKIAQAKHQLKTGDRISLMDVAILCIDKGLEKYCK
jgi:hypothetical protein